MPREEHRFDSGKVEREWTEYFMKDPSKIDELTDTVDKQAETQVGFENFLVLRSYYSRFLAV